MQTSNKDSDLTYTQAIMGLVCVFVGLGLLMFVLEQLPIEALLGGLIATFVIGFAIPQKKIPQAVASIEEVCTTYEDKSG